MSCSEYDLQGLHAGIYLARETNGRLGKYQCLSPTFRSSNAFYTILTLLRRIALFSSRGRTGKRRPLYQMSAKRVQIVASIWQLSLPMRYDQLVRIDAPSPVTIITVQSADRSYVVTTVDKLATLVRYISVKTRSSYGT